MKLQTVGSQIRPLFLSFLEFDLLGAMIQLLGISAIGFLGKSLEVYIAEIVGHFVSLLFQQQQLSLGVVVGDDGIWPKIPSNSDVFLSLNFGL